MSEHTSELEALAIKFDRQERELEERLAEVKKNKQIVSEALSLLRGEPVFGRQSGFLPVASEKYKDMSMTVAIKSILKSPQFQKASAAEILSELQRHGYKSKSKSPKRDVHTRLYRMEGDGLVTSAKENGTKKYSLPKEEDNAAR